MRGVKILVFLFVFLLFANTVSALTTIHIKTLPYQELFITPIKTGTTFESLVPPQYFGADEYGDLEFEYEDFSVSNFEVFVSLKDDSGTTIYRTQSNNNFVTGTEVYFIAAPEGSELINNSEVRYEEELNVTLDLGLNLTTGNSTMNSSLLNSTSNFSNANFSFSGKIVKENNFVKFDLQSLIFLLAGLIFLIVVYLIIKEEIFKGKIRFGKNKHRDGSIEEYDREVKDAKNELKDAKRRLSLLNKKRELVDAEKKLEQDKNEIEKIKAKELAELKKLQKKKWKD
jgi:hypothetical protein